MRPTPTYVTLAVFAILAILAIALIAFDVLTTTHVIEEGPVLHGI